MIKHMSENGRFLVGFAIGLITVGGISTAIIGAKKVESSNALKVEELCLNNVVHYKIMEKNALSVTPKIDIDGEVIHCNHNSY